jgi:H+/Cl- antiporter ClcA
MSVALGDLNERLVRVATRFRNGLSLGNWQRRIVFWAGAVTTGAVAVLFAKGADSALQFLHWAGARSPAWSWLAPPCGLALIAWATRRAFPGSQGSGIPQTIAALALPTVEARDRLLSLRIAFGKLLLTIAGLGCGASAGREGPTVQIGASIMHSLGRFARFPTADLDRGLILAGGAAGVAAAFNTPLAGIVFVIEELSRSFEERTSGTIFTTVIIAGITSVALVGNYTYFGAAQASMADANLWVAVPVCGLLGGLCGGVFARLMLGYRSLLPGPLRYMSEAHPVRFAFLCGVVVALLGWLSAGATFGTGYGEARALVQQESVSGFGFAPEKALATLVSYMSGIPAGIFAPSLAIGAGLGGSVGQLFAGLPAGACVVLTMAAYFAGVVQAPLTALVIVSEMTDSHGLTLPLMGAVFLGRAGSALVCRQSLYRALSMNFMAPRGPTPGKESRVKEDLSGGAGGAPRKE